MSSSDFQNFVNNIDETQFEGQGFVIDGEHVPYNAELSSPQQV